MESGKTPARGSLVRIVVVLVALAKPLVLHELIGRIAQVKRNRQVPCLLHKLHRLVDRSVRRTFWPGQVNNALAQRNASPGMPMRSTAANVSLAITKAVGLAKPMSSAAAITKRRAMNLGSSPPANMRAK